MSMNDVSYLLAYSAFCTRLALYSSYCLALSKLTSTSSRRQVVMTSPPSVSHQLISINFKWGLALAAGALRPLLARRSGPPAALCSLSTATD